MTHIKSRFLALGQFIVGFVGWLIISVLLMDAVARFSDIDFLDFLPVLSLSIQLLGLSFAFLAFVQNLRLIGVGIICALLLYLIGSVLRSPCLPPGLPFPLSVLPC